MDENEKIKENIRSTMAIEGCFMKDNDFKIINQYLNHEICMKDGVDKIKKEFLK
ncbi:MAG: hypothetical protein PHP54_01860 [Clostridia bacterium]|nr:hypothetical protein [Clostridia bacterium]